MLYDAVIFDLDGTLTDSCEGIFNCARYALEKMDKPCPPEDVLRKFLGPPLSDSFINYCGMTEEEGRIATHLYRDRYNPIGWKENSVYMGIRPLLEGLKKQGVFLAVATGKPQSSAETILNYFGLMPFMDAVAGPHDDDMHASKAQLIERVLPKGKKAIMIGDIAGDILAAHACHIDSAAAMWGYGDKQEILDAKPTHAVNTVADLTALLLGDEIPRGLFITFEGVDGCGKTTQIKMLREKLNRFGYETHLTREPGGCPISESIRRIVLAKEDGGMCAETEALLFAASRAQHIHSVILPKVKKGCMVLCDRFVDSSLVYQGMGRNLGMDWIKSINRCAFEAGAPDMTVYLRLPRQESLSRRSRAASLDRMEKSGDDFFARTEAAYENLAREDEKRIVTVDGHGSPEEVAERIWNKVWNRLKEEKA